MQYDIILLSIIIILFKSRFFINRKSFINFFSSNIQFYLQIIFDIILLSGSNTFQIAMALSLFDAVNTFISYIYFNLLNNISVYGLITIQYLSKTLLPISNLGILIIYFLYIIDSGSLPILNANINV